MNGRDEYNIKLKNKNDLFIKNHPYLRGFRNYLSDHSETSIYNYLLIANQFLEYTKKKDGWLKVDDFLDYINHVKIKENGVPRNNSNIINIYHALKNYSTYLYISGTIKVNYMEHIKRPSAKEGQDTIKKREKGFLTKDEIQQMINQINYENLNTGEKTPFKIAIRKRDMAIIMIFLTTGIRCSALCNLDIDNYDKEKKTLIVTDKGNVTRYYNLNFITCEALNKWIDDREKLMGSNSTIKAMFLSGRKERISQATVSSNIQKYTIVINGKHITPHKLRATYGTQLYEATKDIYFVQKAMGHNSPTTTERYIRGQGDVTKQASDIMGSLL